MAPANRPRITGLGRVLVAVYAVLALAAAGRSLVQIIERFDAAPLAFTLSAISAGVYILATAALIFSQSRFWYAVAWIAIVFEMVGVLVVGSVSLFRHDLFPEETVWSWFGSGYVFVPLILPFVGVWWLFTHRPGREAAMPAPAHVERSVW
ncbi:hypothetical protein [Microbacterium binotii]|uniref:Membrane protein n=1 Tax=Microbacterium binotii TaxID=462710 RepID=A0ABN3P4Z9_9MICO